MSLTSPDFESGAYTNFATPAARGKIISRVVREPQLPSAASAPLLRNSKLPPILATQISVAERGPMEDFQKLGALVESRWQAENYSEQLFPEIAAQALAESDLPARVDPWEIIRWVHTAVTLPEQRDVEGRFGNPPITLFSGPRFYIDVYYWLDGTTSTRSLPNRSLRVSATIRSFFAM